MVVHTCGVVGLVFFSFLFVMTVRPPPEGVCFWFVMNLLLMVGNEQVQGGMKGARRSDSLEKGLKDPTTNGYDG